MNTPGSFDPLKITDGNWTAVVAVARNAVIGRGGDLPWRLSSDLKRFKRMTMGHCLLMGRTTYDSIGKPLPGRQTIVLSRSDFAAPGVITVKSIADVQAAVETGRRVMVVGGAQIYSHTLELCKEIWLTRVLADVDGDVYFPSIDWSQFQLLSSESIPASDVDQWPSEFQIWRR
jgi:dihydrofolate reductase